MRTGKARTGLSAIVAASAVIALALPRLWLHGRSTERGADACPSDGEAPATTLADLPEDGRRSLGDAIREARYAVHHSDGRPARGDEIAAEETLVASHPREQYEASFDGDAVCVRSEAGSWSVGLRLTAFGAKGGAAPVGSPDRSANGRRVEYLRDGITEWYVNGDDGLEHGFTIPRAPDGAGQVELVLDVESSLAARATADGSCVGFYSSPGVRELAYTKLAVLDAAGRSLAAAMSTDGRGLAINVDARGAAYPVVVDPLFVSETKVTASDGAAGDSFGEEVAMAGDTAVVGAKYDDIGGNVDQGSAYVFACVGAVWTEQQKLTAADGAASDSFGKWVAVDADTAIVGAQYADGSVVDQGAAYVFVRSGSTWSLEQKRTASDGQTGDLFGNSVSLSGDTAAVGERRDDVGGNANQGSVHVFVRSGSTWTREQKLTASDGAAGDQFGAVALDGDTVVVGAQRANIGGNSLQGAAYVFVRSGSVWSEQQKVTASDGAADHWFGEKVDLDGDTVVIGARMPFVVAGTGFAYVFVRSGSVWTEQQKLTASDGAAGDCFGSDVSIDGDVAVVGAFVDDIGGITNQGSVYVFIRTGSSWSEERKLVTSDGADSDALGWSVSISGNTVAAGAMNDDDNGTNSGSVYFFDLSRWKSTASDGAAGDQLGESVSIDGDTAVAGAYYDDVGGNIDQGSAYVFVRSGAVWTEQQKLIASDGAANDWFGQLVSVHGDTAIVGSEQSDVGGNADQGAAHVFVRSGATWSQQQKLTASDGQVGDKFGQSVSVHADTAVVGAVGDDVGPNADQGSAYVLVRSGVVWTEQQKLTASDGAATDRFGNGVSVSGGTAAVGAYRDDDDGTDSGSAYVFVRSGGVWTEQQKLTASDGAADRWFGEKLDLDGDTVVLGARGPWLDLETGQAYVFVRSGSVWSEQQKLVASDPQADDTFGSAVSVDGDIAVVGAMKDDVDGVVDQGSVYVFVRSGTTWAEEQILAAPDGSAGEGFGWAAAVSGSTVVAGARGDDDNATDSGSVYFFELGQLGPGLPIVTIVANDPNADEAGDPGQFTVTRVGGDQTSDLIVTYTIGGTAENGIDYNESFPLSGTVTILGGNASATTYIDPVDDGAAEGPETVVLTLSDVPSYLLGSARSDTVTIVDGEPRTVIVFATDDSAAEDAVAPEPAVFTIYRTASRTYPLDVNFTLAGTATEGDDYAVIGTSVTIPAGSDFVDVVVTPLDDPDHEGDETVELTLGAGAYQVAGTGVATAIIADDDPALGGDDGGCAPGSGSPAALVLTATLGLLALMRRRLA